MCKAVRVQQPYNHRSCTKSFLQRQIKLIELRGRLVNRVELFRETHASSIGEFVSPVAEDAFVSLENFLFSYTFNYVFKSDHFSNLQVSIMQNQMVELQSQLVPKSSQPLSKDEICEIILGTRSGYSKGLGWGRKPKSRMSSASSSSSNMYDHPCTYDGG